MRTTVLGALASFCLLSAAMAGPAEAALRKPTNIPAEALSEALKTLAKDRQFEVLYRAEVVRDVRTAGAVGEFTPEEALEKLLAGTGLAYKYLDPNTVTVFAQTASPAPSGVGPHDGDESKKEGKKDSSSDFRLAQAAPGQNPSPVSVDKPDEQPSEKKKAVLEEVIVTGTRIPTAAGEQVVPVRTYTREDIARSGRTTVADFLNTVPDVSISASSESGLGSGLIGGNPGTTAVRLHGLPLSATLTLLDGRRVAERNGNGGGDFFNLSSIPAAAIERIEILPVGASAIYGADALGGAINIILRKDFNGFDATASYGDLRGIGGDQSNVSMGWGTSWERGSVSLLGSYRRSSTLAGGQRKWDTTIDFPAGSGSSLFYVYDTCSPGTVYTLDGSNLPGLNSSQAAIPAGISGTPTIQQFAATAGQVNQCNSLFGTGGRYAPSVLTQTEGVLAAGHYALAKSADLFAKVFFSHNSVASHNDISASMATLGASNPYNPFGEDVAVSFIYPGILPPLGAGTTFTTVIPMLGIRGEVLGDWHYEASVYYDRNRYNYGPGSLQFDVLQTALTASSPAAAFNPFAAENPATPQVLQSLLASEARSLGSNDDSIADSELTVRGPVLHLPAGAVEAVIGVDYNRVRQFADLFNFSQTYHRNSYAVFTETRVPLLSSQEMPQGERLAMTLAGRYDHTNDFGSKATWQGGVRWQATDAVVLTGSYGTSYKAPDLVELDQPQISVSGSSGAIDPFRGNEPVPNPVTLVSGGNPRLRPETGDSLTLGVSYKSHALQGFSASLTYYTLNISNFIAQYSAQDLIAYPGLFPGAVLRDAPTAADQALGYPGKINTIYAFVAHNFGDIHLGGVDADASYDMNTRLGSFTPSVTLAYLYKWKTALTPNAPLVSHLNAASDLSGPGWAPRWKGTTSLGWRKGVVSANLAGRYVAGYQDYQYSFFPLPQHELGNFWRFDFSSALDLGQAFFNGSRPLRATTVSLGASNLFNQMPPFSYGFYAPYDPTQYDILGRYVHADIHVSW